jgi:hypothetical protein
MNLLSNRTACAVLAAASVTAVSVAEAQEGAPAQGIDLQVRVPVLPWGGAMQQLFIGYRAQAFTLGVGAGVLMLNWTGPGASSNSTNLGSFSVAPTVFVPLWRSADRTSETYLTGSFAVGALTSTTNSTYYPPPPGMPTTVTGSTNITYLGPSVGVGGQHFLSPTFAIGLEGGFSALFPSGGSSSTSTGGTTTSNPLGSGMYLSLYGTLTASLLIGT